MDTTVKTGETQTEDYKDWDGLSDEPVCDGCGRVVPEEKLEPYGYSVYGMCPPCIEREWALEERHLNETYGWNYDTPTLELNGHFQNAEVELNV